MSSHKFVSAIPIDHAVDGGSDSGQRTIEGVGHVAASPDIGDRGRTAFPGDRAGVVGLPATGGIERGLVQHDGVFFDTRNRGIKLAAVGIVQIQAVSHVSSLAAPVQMGNDAVVQLPDMNLADAWEAVAAVLPDAEAVVCGDERRTWAEFEANADALASALAQRGVGRGTKVGFYLRNSIAYLEAQFATFKLGAVHCNVNYRYTAQELRDLLASADAEVVLFDEDLGAHVTEVAPDLPGLHTLVQVGTGPRIDGESVQTYADLVRTGSGQRAPAGGRSGEDLWFLFTGGTTGLPKGVMWPHSSLVGIMKTYYDGLRMPLPQMPDEVAARALDIADRGKVTRMMTAAPLMHGTANFTAQGTLSQGGTVVLSASRSFDANEFLRLAEREQVTNLVIVGDVFAKPMVTALEDAKAAGKPLDLSHLRILLSSGVMWSAPVKSALREHLPKVTMVDSLGASEVTNAGTSVDRPGGKARTARFTLSSVSAVFTEDGRRVKPGSGERGLLCTGGPLPLGYYKDPDKTAATYRTFEGQRWAVPGDWATVEQDATITLLGRGSGCINTGGEKVYPEEVEEVLKLQEAIADCNVVGVADDRFGQRIVAVVAVNSAISDDDIIASARTHLAGYKVPREIIRVEQVLRGPNGKADYRWAQRMAEGVV